MRRASVPVVLSLLLLAVGAVPARGQLSFRVTQKVGTATATHTVLLGEVFNDSPADAIEVYVTAEALDATGKRLAQGIAWVGSIRARGSETYKIRVPIVRGVQTYRVFVSNAQLSLGRSEAP